MMQQPVVFSFTIFDLVLERTFCSTLNCNAMQETCCSDCLWLKMLTFYFKGLSLSSVILGIESSSLSDL